MARTSSNPWTTLAPPFRSAATSRTRWRDLGKGVVAAAKHRGELPGRVEDLRQEYVEGLTRSRSQDRQALIAAGMVLCDLAQQGWSVRIRAKQVQVQLPEEAQSDAMAEKQRVRSQELIKRDAQLREPAVRRFVRSMETRRLGAQGFASIFSLMRDGRDLSTQLEALRGSGGGSPGGYKSVVDPYIQFVNDEDRCEFTDLRLLDIWRYFRHTWTNSYTSVPGRSMMFLVRDRAARSHPVIGIAALSSPIVQLGKRDRWIGWEPSVFLQRVSETPSARVARWFARVVDTAIDEVYVDDFLEEGMLSPNSIREPNDSVVRELQAEGARQRKLHERFARSQDHKQRRAASGPGDDSHWQQRTRTHLFRSRRAMALAEYLAARMVLRRQLGDSPSGKQLRELLRTAEGARVARKVVKKAKADRVGVAIAEISVCGAVPPYNAILGGKLVAMLAVSPKVVAEYRRRYSTAESEIASSVAGRAIVRPAELVVLGTSSLYNVGSSQYNRIKIPCAVLGGGKSEAVLFRRLGHSEAFGTSHYRDETIDALELLVRQANGGRRVNSIFGEGVSPKMRKVRAGLDLLTFPSERLLRHGRRRTIYGIELVRNACDYLLGIDSKPEFLVPINCSIAATTGIASWWATRWLLPRIESDEVIAEVGRHSLVHPIRHGARVPRSRLPSDDALLFPDLE